VNNMYFVLEYLCAGEFWCNISSIQNFKIFFAICYSDHILQYKVIETTLSDDDKRSPVLFEIMIDAISIFDP